MKDMDGARINLEFSMDLHLVLFLPSSKSVLPLSWIENPTIDPKHKHKYYPKPLHQSFLFVIYRKAKAKN